MDKFKKEHTEYKKDKKNHPFLTSVTLHETEMDKLKTSLAKKVVDEIKALGEKIKQQVTVKGYTGVVSVDTAEMRLHVTNTPLYKKEYKTVGIFGDNINRKELEKARERAIEELKEGRTTGKSKAKSIKVVVTPPEKTFKP